MSHSPRNGGRLSFVKGTGRVHTTSCPSQSEWIQDVLQVMEYRLSYDTKVYHVVPIDALVAVMDYIERDNKECSENFEANELWKIGGFICLVTSL